jgi:hypothetical protein
VTGRSPDGSGQSGLRPEPASRLGHPATVPNARLRHIISEAGYAAYGAVLQANKVKRRTRNLGLPRSTYPTEMARAACEAVHEYLLEKLSDLQEPR